jgi:NADPH:quinone reductase-like Zn-dependent oxidoreductase
MKAVVLQEAGGPEKIVVEEVPTPEPAAGEVRVKLSASALNRRDYWMTKGLYPGMQLPCRPGSDGAGVVDSVGSGVDDGLIGNDVVVYPAREWGDDWQAPGPTFRVLGMPDDGTFAEYICTPADTVYDKPAHLSFAQAAAIPLAGLTSWRAAVTHAEVQPGQTVLITGAGGGVATFAIHWCVSKGADVYVSSGSAEKIAAAKSLGAIDGVDYHDEECYKKLKKLAGGFNAIIDSSGGDAVNAMIDALRPAGRYVFFGSTMGNPSKGLPMAKLFFKQARIQGTTMGSQAEFAAMLDWVTEHEIQPVVDQVLPLEQAQDAFQLMERFGHTGKIVLKNG